MNESLYSNEKSAPVDRAAAGPFDISEVREPKPYIDFGSLHVPSRDGIQVRLEVEEASKRIVAVTMDYRDSSIQLQAFASPRDEGLWHEVRTQLRQALAAQGSEVHEGIGTLGHEVTAKTPITDEGGALVGNKLARFVGVDGPRWFLRGIISGAALVDPLAAGEIEDIFRGTVVVRGETPMPPRDLLPLQVPNGAVLPPGAI
jgi:hypothetical protein